MKKTPEAQCAKCSVPMRERVCTDENGKGKSAKGCPTVSKKVLLANALKEYEKKEIHEFARNASIQEGECYGNRDRKPYVLHPVKPRIVGERR